MAALTPTLLPASSTATERRLAQVGADIEAIPVPVRTLRRAHTTPEALLPWLAWERSVDRWDDGWPVAAKRRAIANAFAIHQHKGTVGALRRVVEPLGFLLDTSEWWQQDPPAEPGTFSLALSVLDGGVTPELYDEVERLIGATKRLSQHLTGLALHVEVRGTLAVHLAAYDGEATTVYPYAPTAIEVHTGLGAGTFDHTIDTLTVYP